MFATHPKYPHYTYLGMKKFGEGTVISLLAYDMDYVLGPCLLECAVWSGSFSIAWALVRDAEAQGPPQTTESEPAS